MAEKGKDYLLEIGVEEMPARFLDPALAELKETALNIFKEQRLPFESIETCGTPRRLTLFARGIAENQEALEMEVKGPAAKVAFKPDGTPTRAAEGFARSQGVNVADLIKKPLGHVEYVFAIKKETGRPTKEVLPEVAPTLINSLHFPKPMRWGDLEFRFARPIRWIVSLFGDELVEFETAGLKAGRTTRGHRFLSKEPIFLSSAPEYFDKMRSSFVLVDSEERKRTIWKQVRELAASLGGSVEEDQDLLNEVNNLVEYPTAFVGDFSHEYLKLPREVLVTPMREHQRYFPVNGPDGGLLPKFIAVKNGAADHLDIVRAGNEKVLKARLDDANFFYQEDLKNPLAEKVPELKKIVFQESLGTIYDKVQRVTALADSLAGVMGVSGPEKEVVLKASYLAKADLVTNMVYEFPELQGIMGREYAERSGESREVAAAIFEHYLPRFAGDRLPETTAGKILSISDKIDNIVGCFSIGIQPSGSQDPYALRRQALGISYIILDGNFTVSLERLVEKAYRNYEGKVQMKLSLKKTAEDVSDFFKQRLRGIFSDFGFSYDIVEAVLAPGYDDFSDALLRARALAEFRQDPAFGDLMTAFIRANNLSKNAVTDHVDISLLEDESEKDLHSKIVQVTEKAEIYLQKQDYRSLLYSIATLQKPLDRFFNSVMVMVDNRGLRENRLAILLKVAALVRRVADLSKIVIDTR